MKLLYIVIALVTLLPLIVCKENRSIPKYLANSQSDLKKRYIEDSVLIYDVSARSQETMNGKKAWITYTIKNIGHQAIDRLEITIYLLDDAGNAICEATHAAIYTSPLTDGGTGPLKPNYVKIRTTTVPEIFDMEDHPAEWAEGKIQMNISSISFLGK